MFEWFLGPVAYEITNKKISQEVILNKVYFNDPDAPEQLSNYSDGNPGSRIRLISHLVASNYRNDLIMNEIQTVLSREDAPERHILILSDRRQHLTDLSKRLKEMGIDYGFYWGGEKQTKLDKAQEAKVILGTFNMASEGMDIPSLNTLVLASPSSDVTQAIGRIFRKVHAVSPIIIDIVDDDYECFRRQYFIRNRIYKSSGLGTKVAKEVDDASSEGEENNGHLDFIDDGSEMP